VLARTEKTFTSRQINGRHATISWVTFTVEKKLNFKEKLFLHVLTCWILVFLILKSYKKPYLKW
jgi:hypothetical protein